MKKTLVIFGITAFLIADTYHDGIYTERIKGGRKYFKMAMYAFAGLSMYLLLKKNPNKAAGMMKSMTDNANYMPIDSNTKEFLNNRTLEELKLDCNNKYSLDAITTYQEQSESERIDGEMKFKRGFNIDDNANVLIVEDIVTTGGSIFELIDLVKTYNANIAGIICIVNRSQINLDFKFKFESLLNYPSESWEEKNCPHCKNNIKITKPGSTGK